MHWQSIPYALSVLTAVTAILSAGVAVFVWRRRPAPGATALGLFMLGVAIWSGGYALEIRGPDLQTIVFWDNVQYFGSAVLPATWLVFALQYTKREQRLNRRNMALLAIQPLLTVLLAWTNDVHGLVRSNIALDTSGLFPVMDYNWGPWFLFDLVYSYLLLVVGTFLLMQELLRSRHLYRRQSGVLVFGLLVPWAANVLFVSGLSPFPGVDLTPFAFTVTGVTFAWGLFGFRLLDVVPVARDAVIENMNDGVVVLDSQHRIVDLNPAAQGIIGHSAAEALGQPLVTLLGLQSTELECQDLMHEIRDGESARTLHVQTSPLADRRGRFSGRLVVLHDITERKRVEEDLRKSEALLSDLYEHAPNAYFSVGRDGLIRKCNDRAGELLGYPKEELLGKPVFELYADTPQGQEKASQIFQRFLAGERITDEELQMRKADGTPMWISLTLNSVRDAEGQVVESRSMVVDITKRKQAQEALWQSEERFRELVENIEDIVYAVDTNGMLTYISPAVESHLGYAPSEVIGRSFAEFVPQEDLQLARDGFRRVLSGDTAQANEYRVLTKSGEILWMRTSGRPILADDRIVGVRGVMSDITERRRAEEELRRLLHAVEQSPSTVVITDSQGNIEYVNPKFTDITGYTREEALGENPRLLKSGVHSSEFYEELWATISAGNEWRGELVNRKKSGELYWELASISPVRSPEGVIARFIKVGEDITPRKEAEQELVKAKEAAEAARRAEEDRRLESERRRRIAESLADVVDVLNSNLSLDEVLDYIVAQAGQLLGNQAAGIYRLEDGKLTMHAAQGLLIAYAAGRDMPIGQASLRQAMELRQPVAVPDLGTHPSSDMETRPDTGVEPLARTWAGLYQALLAVPIIVQDGVYGGIALYYSEPREFPPEEVGLAAVFGDQIALAIENARLKEQVREAAAIAERERLARDLHDAVTQTLFSASLIAEALPRVWERQPDAAQRGLDELRQLTQGALAEMRTLLLELRPAALTEKPLREILGHLAGAVTSRTRVPIALKVEGDSVLPADVQIALYRIAQEALNNMAKHSGASEASVTLLYETERVTLRIYDDGRGFDSSDILPDQLGLGIMHERAESIGASLTIESQPDGGTEVVVNWPAANGRLSDD